MNLHRVKRKLELLQSEQGLNELLFDLIDAVLEHEPLYKPDPLYNAQIIKKLENSYKVFIKEHTKDDPKQQKLFK